MAALALALYASTLLYVVQGVYIPPGPRYTCPVKRLALYPCECVSGSDEGLKIHCENTNLASLGVGLGNLGVLKIPVEELTVSRCNIQRLYGSLFHTLKVRVLRIEHTPLATIEGYTFLGINATLNELHITHTKLVAFPTEAFQVLGNLTVLNIDGHRISSISGAIFKDSVLPNRLERFHLTNGLITDVPADMFAPLRKLKTMDLHGNEIKALKKNQFRGLRDVELVDLSHNNLTKIDSSHLADLTKLSWCNMSHNALSDLPRGTFARNTVLRVLNLSHNKLRRLDSNSFRGMRFIRRMYFNDNQITEVGRGTFGSLTRVGTIDLARNQIKKVDFQMFHQLQYVEILDVSENEVTVIEKTAFKDLFLVRINLSHNAISKIEEGAFENCANITLLDLSHNQIADIPRGAFDDTTYATDLRLSFNVLTSVGQIPLHNMTGLKILNISHNLLETVPRNTFPKLYELHTIDFSHNRIADIWNSVFQTLFSLRSLNLSHNHLDTIKSSTFGSLHTLLELDLSHNRLTEVNKGSLARLASLRTLTLRNNSIGTFFQLPISLSSLDLSYNAIEAIEPLTTFPSMNSLLALDLSYNRLGDSLRQGAFHNLLTLQRIDLSGNEITRPPREALGALATMQYVFIQDNKLTHLPRGAFGRMPVVFELNMANNEISNISERAFEGLLQLLTLNLTNNNLTVIPNSAFQGLVSLRSLDLSHNHIDKIDNKTHGLLDDCLSLERVNLSHNKISFITRKTFPSSPWIPYKLQEVDLSYNHMPVLTYDITVGTKTLQVLNVSHNQLTEIRRGVMGNLTSLKLLDLSHNEFTDFPDKLFGPPPNLTSLYMSNNPLTALPMVEMQKLSSQLRFLDIRDNALPEFHPQLIDFIENGSRVLYDGNPLNCDCHVRPLRRWLVNQISPPIEWTHMVCSSPSYLAGQALTEVSENMMTCADGKDTKGDPRFDVSPDLKFRDVHRDKTGKLTLSWYVATREDVGDFYVTINDVTASKQPNVTAHAHAQYAAPVFETDISYMQRTYAIDALPRTSGQLLHVCVLAKDSAGEVRQWRSSQCRMLPAGVFAGSAGVREAQGGVALVLGVVGMMWFL